MRHQHSRSVAGSGSVVNGWATPAARNFTGRSVLAMLMLAGLSLAVPTHDGLAAAPDQRSSHYAVVGSVKGTDGPWDYASINPATGRFYLAQNGVTALDLAGRTARHLVDGKLTHGVIAIGRNMTMAVGDAGSHSVRFFNGKTGKVEAEVVVGGAGRGDPDAMLFEPKTNTVVAVLGEAGLLVFVDATSHRITGKVALKGKLEFAAADGTGRIFVNEETRNRIAFVDVRTRKLVKEVNLGGCDSPTGLAYDARDSLLVSACENSLAEFVSTRTARVVAKVKTAEGADAVMFDSRRHLVFIPAGISGELDVIAVGNGRAPAIIQRLAVKKGARLGAIDETSGKLYLPTGDFGPPKPPMPYPSFIPGTFEILIVGPS